MGKIKSPLRFSKHYNVDPKRLLALGAFDPVLGSDTPLFIDPVSLGNTSVPEVRANSPAKLKTFFGNLFKLLSASSKKGDVWWRKAEDLLDAHEIRGTCLGYGAGNIDGSGWGPNLIDELLTHAKELISKGVDDPDLFLLVGLFQQRIGPDRISDMVTNVVVEDLVTFTQRVCNSLNIPMQEFSVRKGTRALLPKNPMQGPSTPVLLVPLDILRELPVALSYDDIWDAAQRNAEIRDRINTEIGQVWGRVSREQKSEVLKGLLGDPNYAKQLINQVRGSKPAPYDLKADARGLLVWTELAHLISAQDPLKIANPKEKSVASLDVVVTSIIKQFSFLMEKRDLWKVLHESPSRKIEKVAQTLFFATAYSYCNANNLDITPEAETGNGPVDFKFSVGEHPKILVELKLSKNDVVKGYTSQLPAYVAAENADHAHYVVVDVGRLGQKWSDLQLLHGEKIAAGERGYSIWLIDGTERASASKR